jgi:hypothetical protein
MEDIGKSLPELLKFLTAIGSLRKHHGITPDELLILLATGCLSVSKERASVVIRPVRCEDIAQILSMPKETVRQKVLKLQERGLVLMNYHGVQILKLDDLISLTNDLAIGAPCA